VDPGEDTFLKREKSSRVAALEESGAVTRDILHLKEKAKLQDIPGRSLRWIQKKTLDPKKENHLG